MRNLLIFAVLFLGTKAADACLPHPKVAIILKNDMVTAVVNKYGADLVNSDIELKKFSHSYQWKFTDPGFMCHDTDVFSTEIALNFTNAFGNEQCSVYVKVDQTTGPEFEGGEVKTTRTIKELEKLNCK